MIICKREHHHHHHQPQHKHRRQKQQQQQQQQQQQRHTPSPSVFVQAANRTGSLGLKLRLLLAAYVHCLALGGDLLMADVCGPDAEVRCRSPRRVALLLLAVSCWYRPSSRRIRVSCSFSLLPCICFCWDACICYCCAVLSVSRLGLFGCPLRGGGASSRWRRSVLCFPILFFLPCKRDAGRSSSPLPCFLVGDALRFPPFSFNFALQAELSSARERARHIGAVLGPGTRELVARMSTTPQTEGANRDGGDDEDRAGAPTPAKTVTDTKR